MAKKKPAKKKASAKKPRKPSATHAQLRGVLASVGESARSAGAAAESVAREVVGRKPVTFICSNAACIVGITSGPLNLVFSGSGAALFPVGTSPLFFRIKGPKAPVTVSVQGGTLAPPIAGTPAFGGFTTLTVA